MISCHTVDVGVLRILEKSVTKHKKSHKFARAATQKKSAEGSVDALHPAIDSPCRGQYVYMGSGPSKQPSTSALAVNTMVLSQSQQRKGKNRRKSVTHLNAYVRPRLPPLHLCPLLTVARVLRACGTVMWLPPSSHLARLRSCLAGSTIRC